MNPYLIIIDCDGTLSDSEAAHNHTISGLLAEIGYPHYTPEYCLENFIGKGIAAVLSIVEQRENIRIANDFADRYRKLFKEKIPTEVKPVPHAVPSVEKLLTEYDLCVASNGERDNVIDSLKALGLYNIFGEENIFTKDQVARGKPAPDLFWFAAERKNVAPEMCIVIEDSVSGVGGGVAAGMRTLGFTGVSHNPLAATELLKAAGAERVFSSWPEITDYIKQTCG